MSTTTIILWASFGSAVALSVSGIVRSRRVPADWLFSAGFALFAAECFCNVETSKAGTVGSLLVWQQWRLLIDSALPGLWVPFSLTYARGNADSFLRSWRLFVAGAVVIPMAVAAASFSHLVADPGPARGGSRWVLQLQWQGITISVLLLLSFIVILMNLECTYRASIGTMRWRIKSMLLGLGILFGVRIFTLSQNLLFHSVDLLVEYVNSGALLVVAGLVFRSLLRTRQFAPDVYPSRSVLQGSVTFLVTGVYLFVVGVFAKVIAYLGGDTAFELKAFFILVALVLLAVIVQSDRARLHLVRFLSRYFQRPIYDYRTVWRRFSEGTASRVEQSDLCRVLVRLVADTFQALSVSIWLVHEENEVLTLMASTSLSESTGRAVAPAREETLRLVEFLRGRSEPFDIEPQKKAWADTLKRMHPTNFANGGHRICLPLTERDELIGVLLVGDRVSGIPFLTQDLDMLKCVGDYASISLLNAKYSRSLLQAKEFEAFQAMATFFVHDLKNAASTLSLMLQNLPVHYDDPAFREDTLRGVGKTVDHINHLVSRLGLLRQEPKLELADSDLNDVVAEAIRSLASSPDSAISTEFSPLPRVRIDRQQLSKVITNLVLNSIEASAKGGSIRLSTRAEPNWVVFSIQDSGQGMSAAFIRDSLFRPFQTTKKNGLGIGMFQSKVIVDAHRGRITVASEPGRGTTFQVFLPSPANTK